MSVLGNAVEFLQDFGIFDVILPFLLVFAVVFGILEKTKILGEEKIGKEIYPRKNLNAIVAFVLGMLVVAATKIVGVINEALPKISLLIVVAMSFLIMLGFFVNPEKTIYEHFTKGWMTFLMVLMFMAVILVFLGTIPANDEQSWLGYAYGYVVEFWSGTLVATVILLTVVVWAILWITKGDTGRSSDK